MVLSVSLSFAILVHTAPCCPTMSSLQPRFGLPTYLISIICHSVLLMIHLLSVIWRCVQPISISHWLRIGSWTLSVALVLCLMTVLRILSFSLTVSTFLSMACWLVSSFFTNAFVREHVWHPYGIHLSRSQFRVCVFRVGISAFVGW